MKVTVTVNGSPVGAEVADRTLLVHFLREQAGLTATNVGCDTSSCGACTVLLDGQSVKSCTVLAAQADGRAVQTVEGLASAPDDLHPVQRAFRAEHALQCGFCTPGFLMLIEAYLGEEGREGTLSPEQARELVASNLCRCTGYQGIVEAVKAIAEARASTG